MSFSGLACAQELLKQAVSVQVFEKSRGIGGRIATRRLESGNTFDHGAQYFTARDPQFLAAVESWEADEIVAKWTGRIGGLNRGAISLAPDPPNRWVALPGMSSLPKHLAQGLSVLTNTKIAPLSNLPAERWQLFDEAKQSLGTFDWVVSCAPPLQTAELFSAAADFSAKIAQVRMCPCWAVMVQFAEYVPLLADAAFVQDSPLAWIARNSSKPSRESTPENWVLHATPEWSALHLEETPAEILPLLLEAFWTATEKPRQQPLFSAVHRWRYSIPAAPLAEPFLLEPSLHLAACGDWCGGPRVEGAFLSGLKLGQELAKQLSV